MSAKRTANSKRDLFAEVSEGVSALAESRQGKRTLRTHTVAYRPASLINLVKRYPDTVRRLAEI